MFVKYQAWIARAFALAMVTLFQARPAAATTFNDMFASLESQFGGAWLWLEALAILCGLGLFIFGLIKLVSLHKTKDSKAIPAILMIVGVALMSLTFIIDMTAESSFGSSGTLMGPPQQ